MLEVTGQVIPGKPESIADRESLVEAQVSSHISPVPLMSTQEVAEQVIDLTIEEDAAVPIQKSVAVQETVESNDAVRRKIEATFAPAPLSKRAKVMEDDEDSDSIPDINMD